MASTERNFLLLSLVVSALSGLVLRAGGWSVLGRHTQNQIISDWLYWILSNF